MILATSRGVRVYAYPEPVDLRKGYDGLFGLVKQGLKRDPLGGDLFLFVNRRRDGCKVLVWDGIRPPFHEPERALSTRSTDELREAPLPLARRLLLGRVNDGSALAVLARRWWISSWWPLTGSGGARRRSGTSAACRQECRSTSSSRRS